MVFSSEKYNPSGNEGITNFLECVRIMSKKRVPNPIDVFHLPNGRKEQDKRFVFVTPHDASQFVDAIVRLVILI